jgi:uncharacterized HAD superfamily protein
MRNGYDLDGVLCTLFKPYKSYRLKNSQERKLYKQLKREHVTHAKCIRKPIGSKIFIVTARKSDLLHDTVNWLTDNKIQYDRLLMLDTSRTRNNIIDFKRRMIEIYNIQQFFEDDPKIAKKLQKLCPQTKVVLIPVSESHIVNEEDAIKELK